ncbi:hypothetical protein B0T26DRAFT_672695 [Lasiosphaeria miniovina]|uniref:Uncharacterized protein n=1 Tax=Lasiosphaeria miniovina TaxID=1954250 RepID=A0AA40E5R1_9PEZI|nr:uncharacterized protein B0T26DRAFT_672695 [Lasiosphaeria miniovina]KAK0728105.1 hypothetical protein B0T26DRAFT_672695 [Lasiosphaeria miniovina]
MVHYRFFAFAGLAAALPLNINLGAYSPALVVGDGEISFGGKQDVSALMNALEGAAVNAAAGAAAAPATVAAPAVPATVPAPAETPAAVEAAPVDPALSQQAAALLGMGKEIAPREDTDNADAHVAKRDLSGFDRALTFAEAALTKGPDIQLGTGAEGSGVGIIIDNQPTAVKAEKAEKRDFNEATAPRRRAKVTTMYVRRGVPASLQSSSNEVVAREITAPAPTTQKQQARGVEAPASVSRRDAIDAVNLNVDGDAGLTMTFIEEVEEDDE